MAGELLTLGNNLVMPGQFGQGLNNINSDINMFQNKLTELKNVFNTISNDVDKFTSSIKRLNTSIQEASNTASRYRGGGADSRAGIEGTETRLGNLTSLFGSLNTELDKLSDTVQKLNQNIRAGQQGGGGLGTGISGLLSGMGTGILGRALFGGLGIGLLSQAGQQKGTTQEAMTTAGIGGLGYMVGGLPGMAMGAGSYLISRAMNAGAGMWDRALGTNVRKSVGTRGWRDLKEIFDWFSGDRDEMEAASANFRSRTGRGSVGGPRQSGQLNTQGLALLGGIAQGMGGGLQGMLISGTTSLMMERMQTGLGVGGLIAGHIPGLRNIANLVPGMVGNIIQEAMGGYVTALQANAQIAGVAQYGGSGRAAVRTGLRYGFAPQESAGIAGGIYQGMLGGENLNRGMIDVMMMLQRRYGVSAAGYAQQLGGLFQIGGAGMTETGVRENLSVKIITEGVSAGFGRRLPEFTSAISSSMQNAFAPVIMTNSTLSRNMRGIASLLSASTRGTGLGLQQTQRMLEPILSAPGKAMEMFAYGGGDPYTMSMLWSTMQDTHGGDPWQMVMGLNRLQQNQFTETGALTREGGQFWGGMLQSIGTQVGANDTAGKFTLMRTLQGLGMRPPVEMVENVWNRYQTAREAGRDINDPAVIQEIMTGITSDLLNTQEDTNDILINLRDESRTLMREQLSALNALAGFQAQQLAAAQAMAPLAQMMFAVQAKSSIFLAKLAESAGLTSATRDVQSLFTQGMSELQGMIHNQGGGSDVRIMSNRMFDLLTRMFNSASLGGNVTPAQTEGEAQRGDVLSITYPMSFPALNTNTSNRR